MVEPSCGDGKKPDVKEVALSELLAKRAAELSLEKKM